MILNPLQATGSCRSTLALRLEEDQDFEFIVRCISQAFGDTESWTMEYLTRTRGSERAKYIALDGMTKIGMIRVNYISTDIAVIHDFCMLPSCQGRGFGREILSETVKRLLDQKCSQVGLGVVTQNMRALNLYKSVGFEVSSEFCYYVAPIRTFLRER
ncbi:GNAT family N-acetyltransferase [Lysinibacillus xylanilyticus]|uniref:GNAT family N-acetyltransferase n=1 Tax=Lysinibacillus xylanilyticus TaxID=582475 RepID=UPI002B3B993B|nr:GNAT family N-acetyltransferase [Lysinibacillus xylanilyticus]